MLNLASDLQKFVRNAEAQRVVVALSGGVDSMVLLHVAATLSTPVTAVHVNHGLSPHADQWQQFCEDQCRLLGVDCLSRRVQVESRGYGIEASARRQRYAALAAVLQPGDVLLTAHHRQDQTETFFLRLLRGAGGRGLSAMAPIRPLGQGMLGRPWLTVDKSMLQDYAREHCLSWVDDESNRQTCYDRNFLRSAVLPQLSDRWPDIGARIGQTTVLLREADNLLQEYGLQELAAMARRRERLGESLAIPPLLELSPARRNNALRAWLHLQGYRSPAHSGFVQVPDLCRARDDANPVLLWGDCELRRYRQRLYCLPGGILASAPGPAVASWNVQHALRLADGSVLSATSSCAGLRADRAYQIAFRQSGVQPALSKLERLRARPHDRHHSQRLKKLLQEYALEPWLRDRVPLLWEGDQLAAVGDLWVERDYFVSSTATDVAATGPGMQLTWGWQTD